MNMPTLATQARWMPRARRWLAASAMLAGLGMLGGQVLPRVARLAELRGKQADAARELAEAEVERGAFGPAGGGGILPLRGGVARGEDYPRQVGSDPDDWVRRITEMSAGDRLRAVTVQAGVPEQNGQVWRLPMVLNFEGDYLDACTFLRDAERLPGVVRISTLHVRCTNLPTGLVEVQVAMNAYLPENP